MPVLDVLSSYPLLFILWFFGLLVLLIFFVVAEGIRLKVHKIAHFIQSNLTVKTKSKNMVRLVSCFLANFSLNASCTAFLIFIVTDI